MAVSQSHVYEGARNLLVNCGGVKKGTDLLFVNETNELVEGKAVEVMAHVAREIGARVHALWTGPVSSPEKISPAVAKAYEAAEVTIFNHQMGGMLRLTPFAGRGIKVVNFATTLEILGSPWTRVPYGLWVEVVKALHARLDIAKSWTISNPEGTNLTAEVEALGLEGSPEGFSLRSFPIGVHKPLSTMKARGRIAVRWAMPSGVHTFDPPGLVFGKPVFLNLENGRVTQIEGGADGRRFENHLKRVGEEIGKDGFIVNSWHAGINPLVDTPFPPSKGLWSWWLFAHNNPRFLHFHIVGEEVPGELALPVLDPTVTFDGEKIWDNGRLLFLERDEVRDNAGKHTDPSRAFSYAEVTL